MGEVQWQRAGVRNAGWKQLNGVGSLGEILELGGGDVELGWVLARRLIKRKDMWSETWRQLKILKWEFWFEDIQSQLWSRYPRYPKVVQKWKPSLFDCSHSLRNADAQRAPRARPGTRGTFRFWSPSQRHLPGPGHCRQWWIHDRYSWR